jgi:long-chain acyl-CoA synthetase
VEACCVTGANLGQPLALLMLNVDAARRAAEPAGRAELEASLTAHLQRVNELLDPHERLDCLVVTTEPWTVDNDLITPTFKVKRNRIEELFATHYDRWVADGRAVVWHSA